MVKAQKFPDMASKPRKRADKQSRKIIKFVQTEKKTTSDRNSNPTPYGKNASMLPLG